MNDSDRPPPLVAKPRQQVKMAVDHMMYIKVIFLGYLRELGQSDQAFSRRLMEDNQISAEELDGFTNAIERVIPQTLKPLNPKPETLNPNILNAKS